MAAGQQNVMIPTTSDGAKLDSDTPCLGYPARAAGRQRPAAAG
jgi:hypothetical protein